jgi:hypothetical protein
MPAAASLLLALPVAVAVGVERQILSANLDSDSDLERVVAQEVCEGTDGSLHLPQPTCAADQLSRRRVTIEDTCVGEPYTRRASSVQDYVDRLRVTEADGTTERQEVFFDLRSGATGRGGDIRVVHYDQGKGGACPQPRALFRYPTSSTLGPIPRGAAGRDSFSAFLRDYRRRYPGKEIRLIETYVDRNDAFCCPSFRRVTHFRFSPKGGEYIRYRTRVKRIKRR